MIQTAHIFGWIVAAAAAVPVYLLIGVFVSGAFNRLLDEVSGPSLKKSLGWPVLASILMFCSAACVMSCPVYWAWRAVSAVSAWSGRQRPSRLASLVYRSGEGSGNVIDSMIATIIPLEAPSTTSTASADCCLGGGDPY